MTIQLLVIGVARRVRAWIETLMLLFLLAQSLVARRVRAWIETQKIRVKGLKNIVARRVRAWIETFNR